jgi:hypothetical protein
LAQTLGLANADWLKKVKRCSKVAPFELCEAQNILFMMLFEKIKKSSFKKEKIFELC